MDKAILVIDMPTCCNECFALDDNNDYPMCLITQEQRGYTFRTREKKMDKCPLRPAPEKLCVGIDGVIDCVNDFSYGWNACVNKILGE